MNGRTFTLGELADALTGGDEWRMRLILWPVTSPPVWTDARNRAEPVPEDAVRDLLRLHPKKLRLHKQVAAFLARQAREEDTE